jgi:hypothetical protein
MIINRHKLNIKGTTLQWGLLIALNIISVVVEVYYFVWHNMNFRIQYKTINLILCSQKTKDGALAFARVLVLVSFKFRTYYINSIFLD